MTTGTEVARPSRIADRLLADRHSLPLSIALHLVPGALVVAFFLLLTGPVVKSWGYPPFLGWALALCLALVPFELGLLLWLGRRRNGRFSLRGVLDHLGRPTARGKLAAVVVPLIVWMAVVSALLIPLDNVIYRWLFTWVPFEGADSVTGYLAGYPREVMIVALGACIPLTGVALPLIEEIYFRGFLLPRISWLGQGAPVLNSFLFGVYHFWAPWGFLSKTIFFLPAVWLVWRRKDIRFSVGMHVGTTFLSQTGGTIALALGLFP